MKTVVSLHELPQAEAALRGLHARGFERERISLLVPMPGEAEIHASDERAPANSDEALDVQMMPRNFRKSLGSLVVGLAMFSIPAVGPLLAAGPLAAGIAGAVPQQVQARRLDLPTLLERVGVPAGDARAIVGAMVHPRALIVLEAAEIEVPDLVSLLAHYEPLEIDAGPPNR